MPYNLKDLGIRSEHDAAELEEVLGIKFSDFTDFDLWHWQRQTLSLNQFALTRSYTFAAQSAGVTVYTMRVWEQNNFLGYAQRKEIADLAFCDWLNGLLIQRVQQPDAPPHSWPCSSALTCPKSTAPPVATATNTRQTNPSPSGRGPG